MTPRGPATWVWVQKWELRIFMYACMYVCMYRDLYLHIWDHLSLNSYLYVYSLCDCIYHTACCSVGVLICVRV